jgi:hypothetical protein
MIKWTKKKFFSGSALGPILLCLRYRSPFLNSSFTLLITNTDSLIYIYIYIYSFSFRMKERVFFFSFYILSWKTKWFFFFTDWNYLLYTPPRAYMVTYTTPYDTMYTIFLSLSVTQTVEISVCILYRNKTYAGYFFVFFKFGWDVITYIKLYLLRYFTF